MMTAVREPISLSVSLSRVWFLIRCYGQDSNLTDEQFCIGLMWSFKAPALNHTSATERQAPADIIVPVTAEEKGCGGRAHQSCGCLR